MKFLEEKILIETIEDRLYFDDPILKFDDSMVYGCSLEMTEIERDQFCKEKMYEHLAIYQNFQNGFDKVGLYGNSKPEYEKDWTKIIGSASVDVCNSGSLHQINVVY